MGKLTIRSLIRTILTLSVIGWHLHLIDRHLLSSYPGVAAVRTRLILGVNVPTAVVIEVVWAVRLKLRPATEIQRAGVVTGNSVRMSN